MPELKRPPTIAVLPIECIHPHEEYDPKILMEITNSITTDGVVHDPLLVSAGSLVILDGTHRYRALANLGCCSVPVALYDYFSSEVGIGCWYRCVEGVPMLKPTSFGSKMTSLKDGLEMVKKREALISVLLGDRALISTGDFDIFKAYRLLSLLEHDLSSSCKISYASEEEAVGMLESGLVAAVIASPPIKKVEVIKAAEAAKLFPIKSTRHVINSRPLGLDIPLKWLFRPKEEAAGMLNARLRSGCFRSLPSGTSVNGRRYEEEIYIFEMETF